MALELIYRWRKTTTIIVFVSVTLILIALAVSFMLTNFKTTYDVRLADGVFNARLAHTEPLREKGLGGIVSLGENDAMLFAFPEEAKYGIWMKDMEVPIDIIWLDSNQKVVHIVKNAPPELSTTKIYTPSKPAKYVLEVPAGTVDKKAIRPNISAIFSIDEKEIK